VNTVAKRKFPLSFNLYYLLTMLYILATDTDTTKQIAKLLLAHLDLGRSVSTVAELNNKKPSGRRKSYD
jgi:hypothetical protein